MTIGVNDLGFSDVVKGFATGIDKQSRQLMAIVNQKLQEMSGQYARLIDEVDRQLGARVGDIYITSYPSHVFHDDRGKLHGCGFLDLTSDEAEFIFKAGQTLNEIISEACRGNGRLHFVPRLPEAFHGHGYCCSESWFVGVKESFEQDQNFDGPIHPNPRGHLAIAEKIADEVQQVITETADERWSRFLDLGGQLGSGVAVTAGGPHALDVFVVGENNELVHRSFDGGAWSGWHNLGGQLASGVAVTAGGPHDLDVFVVGENFELVHRFLDAGAWSGWHNLGGQLARGLPVTVTSGGPHGLDVFVIGKNNELVHRSFDGGAWSGWHNLGGQLASGVAVTAGGPHDLDVFVVGENFELVHRFLDAGAWSGWHNLGGQLAGGVAVTSGSPHDIDVFVRGEQFELVHRFLDAGKWSGWHNLGGTLLSGLAVTSGGPHAFDVFTRGKARVVVPLLRTRRLKRPDHRCLCVPTTRHRGRATLLRYGPRRSRPAGRWRETALGRSSPSWRSGCRACSITPSDANRVQIEADHGP